MNRRHFLQTATSLSVLLILPTGCRRADIQYDWNTLAHWATGLPEEQVSTLGVQAAAVDPPERWRAVLPELPDLHWHLGGASSALDAADIKALVQSETRRQFSAGESLIVGGWVVSRIEAALSALTAG